jgi:glycosyltransferase involved in cell wall biosynthesis
MARLRIAMLAPFGMRPKGTLAARMLPLAQALVRRGHAVSIVAPAVQNPQDAGTRVLYDGVPVHHIPAPRLPGPLAAAEQARGQYSAAQADLLHLFKPKGYSGLAALLARLLRPQLPLVVDTDDWEGWGGWNDLLPYPLPAKWLFAWQERNLPRRADAVTVVSRTLETQVWGFGVAPGRVVYLPNGIGSVERWNAQTFQHPNVPTLLLYTRFWEFDVRDMLVALIGIVARCPAARLVVIGRGERGEEREFLRLAERAGVAAAIDYRGWVEPAQIPALLAAADLALVPMDDTLINRARGFAKLLELMAAGLPIVAGRVGQVAEYIEDGRSGVLVAPGDPAALAGAAIELLGDQAARARLGRAAQQRAARHFTWDRLALQAETAYQIARQH